MPSSERSQDSASAGSTRSVSHDVSVRPSKRYPSTPDEDASLAMARLRVSGSEMVAIVSVPPGLPIVYSNCSALILSWSTIEGGPSVLWLPEQATSTDIARASTMPSTSRGVDFTKRNATALDCSGTCAR